MSARRLFVEGRVQRVGYRDWTVRTARALGITGWVRSLNDGGVEILAIGEDQAIDALIDRCREGPPLAAVIRVEASAAEDAARIKGFTKRFTV